MGKSLRMYQNFSTMPHIMVPITSTGIVLSALCFVFRYGGNSRLSIWQFPWDTVCGKRKYPSWNWRHPWYGRLCRSFLHREMSSSCATAGMPKKTWCVSWMSMPTWMLSAMLGMTLLFMTLHHSLQAKRAGLPNMGDACP